MKTVEVLISAMYQKDLSLIDKTGIKTDALLINQCDVEEIKDEIIDNRRIRYISTKERGLSRSRNMALRNAQGTFCLLCDDDEILEYDYEKKILNAFTKNKKADIICFSVKVKNKKFPTRALRIGYLRALKISSCQIVLKRDSIINAGIKFNKNYGSGTTVGSGEENIFLYDCLKAGLKIHYIPDCIAKVKQEQSQWFRGFNEQYFYNRGKIIQRMMGKVFGSLYGGYFIISKYPLYKKEISSVKAFRCLFQGMFSSM